MGKIKKITSGLIVFIMMLSTAVSLPTNVLRDNLSTIAYAEQISNNVGSLLSTAKTEVDNVIFYLKKDNTLEADSVNTIYTSLQKIENAVKNEGYQFTAVEQLDLAYINTQFNSIELGKDTSIGAHTVETAMAFDVKIMDETKQFLSFLMSQSSVATSGSYSNFKQSSIKYFTDVGSEAWYYNWIAEASKLGIIDGMDDNTFAPEDNLTYAQSLALVCRVNAIYYDRESELDSYQGTTDHWASGIEAYAKNYGITNFNYDLDSICTRDTMAYMFYKALPESEYTETDSLNRENYINVVANAPGSLAVDYVAKLYLMGVMVGDDDGFELDQPITRAEAAAMIVRLAVPDKRAVAEPEFDDYQKETLALVNASRAEAGLPALKLSKVLCKGAEELATEYSQGATAHLRLNGYDARTLFIVWGIGLSRTGENYATGYYSASAVHDGWMNSEGHKAQIMQDYGDSGYVGIAKVRGSDGKNYWVEEFATALTFSK